MLGAPTVLPACTAQHLSLSVGAAGATGSIAIGVHMTNHGVRCHLTTSLQLAIERPGGELVAQIQGNPATGGVDMDVAPGGQSSKL